MPRLVTVVVVAVLLSSSVAAGLGPTDADEPGRTVEPAEDARAGTDPSSTGTSADCLPGQPTLGGCARWRTAISSSGSPGGYRVETVPDEDRVYFLTARSSSTLVLGLADTGTGEVLATRPLGAGSDGDVDPGGLELGPTGQVLVHVRESHTRGVLVSVSPDLGSTNWEERTTNPWTFEPGPRDQIYVMKDAGLAALNASTGSTVWLTSMATDSDRTLNLHAGPNGEYVFRSDDSSKGFGYFDPGHVAAFDADTGDRLWMEMFHEFLVNKPYFYPVKDARDLETGPAGDLLYIAIESREPGPSVFTTSLEIPRSLTVEARDVSTGEMVWRQTHTTEPRFPRIDPPPLPLAEDTAGVDDLEVGPEGRRVYVASSITGPGGATGTFDLDVQVDAFTAARGIPLWTQREASPWLGTDDGVELEVAPDGDDLFLGAQLGCTYTPRTLDQGCVDRDVSSGMIVEYDAVSGTPIWKTITKEEEGCSSSLGDIAVSPRGRSVFAVGRDQCSQDPQGNLLALGTGDIG